MSILRSILHFINPLARLGKRDYSVVFPFSLTLICAIFLELYAYVIAHNPNIVGIFAIFIFIALIIYFSFRDGIKGGLVTTVLTILYYFYIIYTRKYEGQQLQSGIETTFVLGFLYLFLAGTIGWLKQKIDVLIETEADEKKRLRAIVQQLPVGVIITDAHGKLQLTNKQLDTILGMRMPLDFTFGKDSLPYKVNGKKINPSQSPLVKALTSGKAVTNKEYAFEKSPGIVTSLQVSSTPIHNRQGKVIAAASIVTDISSQKELEKRKDDFVNMASHELKTPITSMKLYIDSLLKQLTAYNDPKAIKTLTGIKYQTERLQELVSDLLDVSRLQTGKLSFRKEKFDIVGLIQETIDHLQASAKQQIVFQQSSPILITADKFRMYQVLTNLITNAAKYSAADTIISLAIKKHTSAITIQITDKGIGINKEQQKKIFDRLYQVTDPKEKTFPGLGMGLYITKEIIKRHKGKIWVESVIGKGSTFYITLPIK